MESESTLGVWTDERISRSAHQRLFQERYARPPREKSIIGLRLQYSDWRYDDRSSRDHFYPFPSPPLATELRIQRIDRNV